jgi:hypothetical protein
MQISTTTVTAEIPQFDLWPFLFHHVYDYIAVSVQNKTQIYLSICTFRKLTQYKHVRLFYTLYTFFYRVFDSFQNAV